MMAAECRAGTRALAPTLAAPLIALALGGAIVDTAAAQGAYGSLGQFGSPGTFGSSGAYGARRATIDEDVGTEERARKIVPSISAQLLWTNNVELRAEDRRSDVALTVTPRVLLYNRSDRTLLTGTISLPLIVYAETSSKDQVFPEIDVAGRLEVVDRYAFVEARANVHTQYFSPFGARSSGLENVLLNQYTAQSYSVTPYIVGNPTGTLRYSLRDENTWSIVGNVDNAALTARNFYTNFLTGNVERLPTPFGWGFDLVRNAYYFEDPDHTQTLALIRARGVWQPQPQLQLQLSAGYENNDLPFTSTDGATYGAAFLWRPTDRTKLDLGWEHRFFGGSYRMVFEHRTPRTSWHVQASRNVTSYPEQLARLPADNFVPAVLDAVFASRIPDPLTRAQFISNFMQERGLSLFLSEPVAIYAQQVYLAESASAAVGLLGVRNSIVLSVQYLKTEPISDELPVELLAINRAKQLGARASWTYELAPRTSMTLTGSTSRADATPPLSGSSDHHSVKLDFLHTLSPVTTAYAGGRYQKFRSDFERGYNEAAVFVGIRHTFK